VLLIAPNLANKKDGVDHQPGDEQPKKDDAKHQGNYLAPVKNDPTHVQKDREGDKANAKGDKKRYCFGAARDAHGLLVYDSAEPAP
jgi:hypothetical protein